MSNTSRSPVRASTPSGHQQSISGTLQLAEYARAQLNDKVSSQKTNRAANGESVADGSSQNRHSKDGAAKNLGDAFRQLKKTNPETDTQTNGAAFDIRAHLPLMSNVRGAGHSKTDIRDRELNLPFQSGRFVHDDESV